MVRFGICKGNGYTVRTLILDVTLICSINANLGVGEYKLGGEIRICILDIGHKSSLVIATVVIAFDEISIGCTAQRNGFSGDLEIGRLGIIGSSQVRVAVLQCCSYNNIVPACICGSNFVTKILTVVLVILECKYYIVLVGIGNVSAVLRIGFGI